MRPAGTFHRQILVVIVVIFALVSFVFPSQAQVSPSSVPQSAVVRPLITQAVDDAQRTVLGGNKHPLARAQYDKGAAPGGMPMQRMELVLKRSAAQESALETLLESQQDKSSPNFHAWLTPAQFGKQFGPSDSDIQTITTWLQSHGFQVAGVANGRTSIEFSGSVTQVQSAFRTEIHRYEVAGESHWANASDPSIPTALVPAVNGVLTLHNFPRHSYLTLHHPPQPAPHAGGPVPLFTFTSNQNTFYGLGPTDFATIYNVLPLWTAGIDGTGQTIAIVGESNIHLSDVEEFRTLFGLAPNDPTVILNGEDPGVAGDETEALLDVSWSGAVAKNATIDYVVSATTATTLGVDLSALYIVDNNLAPVMSESYGECEATIGNAGNAFFSSLWQQAAAQGITVMVSAGDAGSAGCDDFDSQEFALLGIAVSGFASTPYNVAVGGTDFNQTAATAPTYWNATNDPTTAASAKGYIPETTWNGSCAATGVTGCNGDPLTLNIVAGSGGPSSCATQSSAGACSAGHSKPSWQTGAGVPMDGVRDLPDVSLFASNGVNGSFYILCQADAGFFIPTGPCNLQTLSFVGVGGTSASAPAFAGIMALVNQKMSMAAGAGARQGNANYVLYKLAAQTGASCNSTTAPATGSTCIFYDVTQGNNSVPCYYQTPNCGPSPTSGGFSVLVDPNNPNDPAWSTATGYDMATGLGTVNAANLVNAWNSVTFAQSATTLQSVTPTTVTHGQPVNVSASVAAQSGTGTPTGAIELMAAPANGEEGVGLFPLTNGLANGTTTLLPGGTYNVTAHYAGDAKFGSSDSAPIQVTVSKENSQSVLTTEVYDPIARTFSPATSIPFGSIFVLRGQVTGASGKSCIPNPQETQAACPTGSIGFTMNGKTLDAGTYALNSEGYAEDQTLAPEVAAVGMVSFASQYAGDNSYNASQTTSQLAVTQAPTNLAFVNLVGLCCTQQPPTLYAGQAFEVDAPAYTNSILQAPTGTISLLQNGVAPTGTVQITYQNGSFTGNLSTGVFQYAYISAFVNTSIDTPGTYTFTASYPGDANYAASQAQYPATLIVVDTTFNLTTPIPDLTISAPGQTGTATVTVNNVDNFPYPVNITCTLPTTMQEATCPAVTADISNVTNVAAQIAITTTAPHPYGSPAKTSSAGVYGTAMFAGFFVLLVPGLRRRKLTAALAVLLFVGMIASCGGGGGSTTPPTDPGTAPGTYAVTLTATSVGITRTATFNVVVQ